MVNEQDSESRYESWLGGMNIIVVYVLWEESDAIRFSTYYRQFPSDYSHTLIVVANHPNWRNSKKHFDGLNAIFIEGDNIGHDIGAFQCVANQITCDLMVFFGSSSYVTGRGWLKRMVESYQKHGVGIYGSTASGEDLRFNVFNHIRTTGFWMPPELLKSYPYDVESDQQSRYAFEHGQLNITNWVLSQGGKALMVTWLGEYEQPDWSKAPNAFRNGNQSAVIVRDRLCDPPFWT